MLGRWANKFSTILSVVMVLVLPFLIALSARLGDTPGVCGSTALFGSGVLLLVGLYRPALRAMVAPTGFLAWLIVADSDLLAGHPWRALFCSVVAFAFLATMAEDGLGDVHAEVVAGPRRHGIHCKVEIMQMPVEGETDEPGESDSAPEGAAEAVSGQPAV